MLSVGHPGVERAIGHSAIESSVDETVAALEAFCGHGGGSSERVSVDVSEQFFFARAFRGSFDVGFCHFWGFLRVVSAIK